MLLSLHHHRRLLTGLLAMLSALLVDAPAQTQAPGPGGPPGLSAAPDPFIESTARWDANHDGVLTCDEWRLYMNRLFTLADKNGDGFLDANEFRAIQKLEPIFADADLSYFDDNHDRRVGRAEFVDKPSPFFARYDTNHDCRVTSQEMSGTPAASGKGGRPGGGSPGMGGGMGGGRGGF